MCRFGLMLCLVFFMVIGPVGNLLAANTVQDFDNPGTNYSLVNSYGSVAAQLFTGAPPDNFLRLNYNNAYTNLNTAAFDRTQTGLATSIVADFDFRMFGGGTFPADGIGFVLLNTAHYGTSGDPGLGISEEPNATGSLGIGFDIFNNFSWEADDNHLSVHFNNVLLGNFPLSIHGIDLHSNSELFDHAHIVADLAAGTVSVELTPYGGPATPIIGNLSVPGLAPYEARVAFGARTGGFAANHDIDNINVSFGAPPVPLPGTALLFSSGLLGLLPFVRRKK